MTISDRQLLLLTAAVSDDPKSIRLAWQQWAEQISLEDTPYPESRLHVAAYANIRAQAPDVVLPAKLHGKARATFVQNHARLRETMIEMGPIPHRIPMMLIKGIAMCELIDAWASRHMGDIDVLVKYTDLKPLVELLRDHYWQPKYSLTWESLEQRIPVRRDSWNLESNNIDLDVHWRVIECEQEVELERAIWATAISKEFHGVPHLIPSPELQAIITLNHGFRAGTLGDQLQTIVDLIRLLPRTDEALLMRYVKQFELHTEFLEFVDLAQRAGVTRKFPQSSPPEVAAPAYPPLSSGLNRFVARRHTRVARMRRDSALLKYPALYSMWEWLGRPAILERWHLRLLGPMTKLLVPQQLTKSQYDIRNGHEADLVCGPGWGWPDPNEMASWIDRADGRLLIVVTEAMDARVTIVLSELVAHSHNRVVDVFANGVFLARIDSQQLIPELTISIVVPHQLLHGNQLEISIRPITYRGTATRNSRLYHQRRSLPVTTIMVTQESG
ncbi:MAG: hypothetical protein F2839_03725 [Actinobacteria bacterium]|uniref:Unannotated protein n=1 Tax=freshwater metagenome TaxID=449393 RepID=A0A6J5ZDZ8_9ZZZZ|nr:hypothetical protein [Actinomycetota bacterium]